MGKIIKDTIHANGIDIGIEQNRCAMACQGCGIAIFYFL